jgi:outer membrane protein OmpA-like peptidoglycan-associated protein
MPPFLQAIALASLVALTGCATQTRDADIATAATKPIKLPIAQIDRGVAIWLPSQVMFEFGQSRFNEAEAAPYLDKVAHLLRDKTQKMVALEGHTDNVGSADFNMALSLRRAESVRDAMLARGVPTDRMSISGHGLSKPVAPNDTETGRAINRRVEVVVLEERIENLTRDEPANSFESAFDKLRALLDPNATTPKPTP